MTRHIKKIASLIIALQTTTAAAQRGETIEAKPSIFTSPSQGYPGFFDTNMVDPDTVVIEWPPIILPLIPVPNIAVDYGVNERLTLGTNGLLLALPSIFGLRAANVKARSLLYGSESMQSTATAYIGYVGGGKSFSTYWQALTTNNAWKLNPENIVYANAALVNFGLEAGDLSSTDYSSIQFSTAAISGGHQYLISETAGLSTVIMVPVWTSINIDTVSAALDLSANARKGDAMWGIARLSFDLRRDPWLYSFGGVYNHGVLKDVFSKTGGIAPWFSVTRRY